MPLSLKSQLKKFAHKGQITQEEYDALIKKLDGHDKEIRNKVIDEFAEKLKWELGQLIFPDSEKFAYPVKEQEQICHQNMTLKRAIRLVDYFAEQLRRNES